MLKYINIILNATDNVQDCSPIFSRIIQEPAIPICILSNHSKMSIDSQAYDEVFNIDTAIGPQGYPVKGSPELSPQQSAVVRNNIQTIKRDIRELQREIRKR